MSTAVCSHRDGSASLGAQTWLLRPGTWASSGKESPDVSVVSPAVLGDLWPYRTDTCTGQAASATAAKDRRECGLKPLLQRLISQAAALSPEDSAGS